MGNANFVTDPMRTGISLAYKNEQYIADMALPRKPVTSLQYKYTLYNKADSFNVSDATIGRTGKVNEIEFGATETTSAIKDYALAENVPQQDIDHAKGTDIDPMSDATEYVTDQIMLAREVRVASLVHTKANYTSSETISGTDKWTDPESNPITQILDGMNTSFVVPNYAVTNRSAALELRRNPAVVKAYNGTLGDTGLVPLSFLEQLLGIKIIIGTARKNTANKGQTLSLSEIWQPDFAMYYLNPVARVNKGLTFGWSAEYKNRRASTKVLSPGDFGLDGGTRVMVGEQLDEKIVAADVGYYLEAVI